MRVSICELELQIIAVIDAHAPHLLQRNGIGPDSAAALLITAGDNPDRMNKRSILRRPLRRQPHRGVLGQNPPTSPQPRRRPPRQPETRFGDTYQGLRPVDLDPQRLELYRYAQTLSLIEGPLRIADTDFPNRQWMLDLAEWNIMKALAAA